MSEQIPLSTLERARRFAKGDRVHRRRDGMAGVVVRPGFIRYGEPTVVVRWEDGTGSMVNVATLCDG